MELRVETDPIAALVKVIDEELLRQSLVLVVDHDVSDIDLDSFDVDPMAEFLDEVLQIFALELLEVE